MSNQMVLFIWLINIHGFQSLYISENFRQAWFNINNAWNWNLFFGPNFCHQFWISILKHRVNDIPSGSWTPRKGSHTSINLIGILFARRRPEDGGDRELQWPRLSLHVPGWPWRWRNRRSRGFSEREEPDAGKNGARAVKASNIHT